MRSHGGLRGVLKLAPKRHAELYTREDLELLEIMAGLGAVALHNAQVFAELETLRRLEADAARDEKRFALGMLGAEMTHEIAYPLNFLRYLLGRGARRRPLEARDLEAGQEEIGRLERMFATLRKLQIPMARLRPVLVFRAPAAPATWCARRHREGGSRWSSTCRRISPVVAEPDRLVQILANLLRNAAQAVPPGAAVGIVARRRQPHRPRGLG